jgi:DNA-binding CsgD family transcriptional regulator/N-acetylneuraminic acid mutarotase
MMTETNELSEREVEILSLVATGATNKEIAQKLFISSNTVKVHLRNIFSKIEVNSRTEAAMYAVSNGLVEGVSLPGEAESPPSGQEAEPASPLVRSPLVYLGAALLLLVVVIGAFSITRLANGQPENQPVSNPPQPTASPRWQSLAGMPTARYGLALAAYEDNIYAIAGSGTQGVVNVVERFQPASNLWQQLQPKPTAVSDVSAAVIGGRIFVPGGRLSSGEVTNVLEIFDPRQDEWQEGAALPTALSAYALAAFEGKLYLFGGWDGEQYRAMVYEYDPEQDHWSEKTPMPTGRGFASAVVAAGRIFVLGGKDQDGALSDNEVYLPERDSTGDNPWETAAPLPEGRYAMGATGMADIIYVIGGKGAPGAELPSLAYFTQSDEWQLFEAPSLRLGSGLGLVSHGPFLYALGGEMDQIPSANNLAYQAIYTVSIPVIVK